MVDAKLGVFLMPAKSDSSLKQDQSNEKENSLVLPARVLSHRLPCEMKADTNNSNDNEKQQEDCEQKEEDEDVHQFLLTR